MNKVMEVKFSEEVKKHSKFTKVEDNTWFIQSNPKSICQSYYVTVLPHAIVMYGDYDGVIVKPHESGKINLINWMRCATTLSYFAEKVNNGNRHHQTKGYDEDTAKENFIECLKDNEYSVKVEGVVMTGVFDEKLLLMVRNILFDGMSHYDFDKVPKRIYEVLEAIDEMRFSFKEDYLCSLQELENTLGISDLWEWSDAGDDYTKQLKWQHQCLLWWAKNAFEVTQ